MTREKHREYMRQWGRKNRDKVRAYNRKSYLRRKEAKPKTKNRWGDGRRRIDPSEKAEMFEKKKPPNCARMFILSVSFSK